MLLIHYLIIPSLDTQSMPVPQPSFLKPNQPLAQTSELRILISKHLGILISRGESTPFTLISCYHIAEVTLAYWAWEGLRSPPLQINHRLTCKLQNQLSEPQIRAQQTQYGAEWGRHSFSSCASCILGENTTYWFSEWKCPLDLTTFPICRVPWLQRLIFCLAYNIFFN